ncbi:hypothetical protein BKA65DRAFT_135207 [Rhexocercosporidium sp. MPI-PUGE-AT-0058]|nr:hypothetical protein BKA65DRAFT_135207 [Rhexocercosporidium sp. MPI-PUGE-AT-0058]
MKFSSASVFPALFAFASASLYTQQVDVICTGSDPTTVTQTVTVTAPCTTTVPYNPPPYVTTDRGTVTSVEYHGSRSSIWVYPTGSPSRDCTVAVYENNVFITVIVVNIDIKIVNGETKTVTSTVTDAKPTWTPKPPQTSTYTSTYTPRNSTTTTSSTSTKMPLSTGSNGRPSSSSSSSSSIRSSSSSSSKPYSTGTVIIPSSTGYPTKATGPVVPPKPTATSIYYRAKGRRAAQWYE